MVWWRSRWSEQDCRLRVKLSRIEDIKESGVEGFTMRERSDARPSRVRGFSLSAVGRGFEDSLTPVSGDVSISDY